MDPVSQMATTGLLQPPLRPLGLVAWSLVVDLVRRQLHDELEVSQRDL